ncbi:MAG: GNAT family N-acetyltransferase [bacterium]|nr:GNAT family N-acetyltransferase [bacterium]
MEIPSDRGHAAKSLPPVQEHPGLTLSERGRKTSAGWVGREIWGLWRGTADSEMLLEIGRQREIAFRQCGEGSGLPLDLDPFDQQYLHLFSWSRADKELIGAYRLAPTDKLKARDGLYVQTLFKIHPRLMDQLRPGLEMGRSFVRAKYQRSPAALALLWKGIARFVSLHPQYSLLFGPVSISKEYEAASQQMIVHSGAHCHEQGGGVKPFRRGTSR